MDLPFWGWITLGLVLAGLLLLVSGVRLVRRHPASAEARAFFAELMAGSEFQPWPALADAVCREVFPTEDPQALQRLFERHGFEFNQQRDFSHQADAALVDRFIVALFPEQGVEAVRAELARCHNDGSGVGAGRLQLDILYLSEGDFHSLPALVEEASRDFRDVLSRAEGPRSLRALTGMLSKLQAAELSDELKDEIRREMSEAADEDLRCFVSWLRRTLPLQDD